MKINFRNEKQINFLITISHNHKNIFLKPIGIHLHVFSGGVLHVGLDISLEVNVYSGASDTYLDTSFSLLTVRINEFPDR